MGRESKMEIARFRNSLTVTMFHHGIKVHFILFFSLPCSSKVNLFNTIIQVYTNFISPFNLLFQPFQLLFKHWTFFCQFKCLSLLIKKFHVTMKSTVEGKNNSMFAVKWNRFTWHIQPSSMRKSWFVEKFSVSSW